VHLVNVGRVDQAVWAFICGGRTVVFLLRGGGSVSARAAFAGIGVAPANGRVVGEVVAFVALGYFGLIVGDRLVLVGSERAKALLRGLRKGNDNPRGDLPDLNWGLASDAPDFVVDELP